MPATLPMQEKLFLAAAVIDASVRHGGTAKYHTLQNGVAHIGTGQRGLRQIGAGQVVFLWGEKIPLK